jgi:sugar lactone lactonase YvrE
VDVELVSDLKAELGEGPVWDVAARRLLFVDILRGHVHEFDPASGADRIFAIGRPVSAVVPTSTGDLLVAAKGAFLSVTRQTGATAFVGDIDADRPTNRTNDGYCDSRGRFWAGTMSLVHERQAGALYRLDPDRRVTRMLTGVSTSNGIDWSPDDRLMYYVDTPTSRIDVFDFDAASGTIANRRTFAAVPVEAGYPDGLIVDAEGGVWIALWAGGALRRHTPDGRLDRVITMPVTHPTKCAFGGPDLADLYITSAWTALSPSERAAQPHAGGLFRCRPGVKGRPAHPYAG